MNRRNAIVIVVDRLGAGYLGTYGNTWVETPAFNRLASQSLVWENVFATTPTLAGFYHALATGRHSLTPDTAGPFLWQQLQETGIHTALLTDEPLLQQLNTIAGFQEWIEHPLESVQAAAKTIEQTHLCQMFVAALEWLARSRESFCLLIHCRGMNALWDAPREYRERFRDEEDPSVPDFVEPPRRSLGQDVDPDEIWGITQGYAGQVALLDDCLEMLLEWLDEQQYLGETLFAVTSPRGYPLGEHGHLGERGDSLHEELLHLPLVVRYPDQRYAMERSQTLIEPADLCRTLAEWFHVPAQPTGMSLLTPFATDSEFPRGCVVSVLEEARSIRTPVWFLRRSADQTLELYAKPDDRWEVNEVATRCGPIAEELASQMAEFERLAREDRLDSFPPLPESLLRRAD